MSTYITTAISRYSHGQFDSQQDIVVCEEPLQIHLRSVQQGRYRTDVFASTMRTADDDEHLAVGLLLSCGVIQSVDQIEHIKMAHRQRNPNSNMLIVTVKPDVHLQIDALSRQVDANSACGVCGQQRIERLYLQRCDAPQQSALSLTAQQVLQLPRQLNQQQALFNQTGASHAMGLFDHNGTIVDIAEDIGRHNAMDKLLGRHAAQLLQPSDGFGVLLSGRASFELMQKAAMLHIQMVVAIGAPSSLAVQVAQEMDMTLIGFVSGDGFNLYCGQQRVLS
ncbi:formate dehydrogenase accessory sulfurtransferase FdhD [Neptunicella sp.]|uniref:formate dehydrogenase accessory sulfurtransferase FdhD n=1 Tax=Neptunicella sp. TaxID=2125986 RepID=UPI003F690F36